MGVETTKFYLWSERTVQLQYVSDFRLLKTRQGTTLIPRVPIQFLFRGMQGLTSEEWRIDEICLL
jgi:hypothetical protein